MALGSLTALLGLSRASRDLMAARADSLMPAFLAAARATGMPAELLLGVAVTESALQPSAHNAQSGAAGLMQVIPANFDAYQLAGDPYNVDRNTLAGARILADSIKREGTIFRGLARYSGHVSYLAGRDGPQPDDYVSKVLRWAAFFGLENLG